MANGRRAGVMAAWVALTSLGATAQDRVEVLVRDATILDVATGRLVPHRDIVIRGTVIERVVPSGGSVPPAKTTIGARGKVVVPGFIDAEVRLADFEPTMLQRLLAEGVTAVGSVGLSDATLTAWRSDLNTGRLYSPRLAVACRAGAAASTSVAAPDAIHAAMARLVHDEGRSPAEAIRRFTADNARALCLDKAGEIVAGAPADLVVLSANPLDDIRHTRAIDAVVFRGEALTHAHLNLLRGGRLPLPTPARRLHLDVRPDEWAGRPGTVEPALVADTLCGVLPCADARLARRSLGCGAGGAVRPA